MSSLKEKPEFKSENFDTVKNLDPEIKMAMILDVFHLRKNEVKNKKRKAEFIKLMSKYHEQVIFARPSITPESNITSREITDIHRSDENKKKLHDQIMEILRTISLSVGLSKNQRLLAEYFVRNRSEVERLIVYYFQSKDVEPKSNYLLTKQSIDAINGKIGPEEE